MSPLACTSSLWCSPPLVYAATGARRYFELAGRHLEWNKKYDLFSRCGDDLCVHHLISKLWVSSVVSITACGGENRSALSRRCNHFLQLMALTDFDWISIQSGEQLRQIIWSLLLCGSSLMTHRFHPIVAAGQTVQTPWEDITWFTLISVVNSSQIISAFVVQHSGTKIGGQNSNHIKGVGAEGGGGRGKPFESIKVTRIWLKISWQQST